MRVRIRPVSILLVFALGFCSAASAQVRDLVGARFDARITSVIDGDTVDLVPDGEQRAIRVRLEGIDAPERGEAFNDAARRLTRVLLFDQRAKVQGRDVDRYGRLVARVVVGAKDVSVELVRAGLACHYTVYFFDPLLAAGETQARTQGRGFWAANATKPRCTTRQSPAAAGSQRGATAGETAVHGNTSSQIYHAPACPNYNCQNCTRVFRSEAEAQAAGFRPAGDCFHK